MDTPEEAEFWQSIKASFMKTWIHGFEALLGWPESRTLSWANKWRDQFEAEDEGRIFFHADAEEWMVFELIPETMKKRLAQKEPDLPPLHELYRRFGVAIRGAYPRKDADEFGDEDWRDARTRVQTLLNEFGESLPDGEPREC